MDVSVPQYLVTEGTTKWVFRKEHTGIKGYQITQMNDDLLLWACSRGNVGLLTFLLKSGHTPNGCRALKIAVKKNHKDIVEVLLKQPGVDPSVDDNYVIIKSCKYGYIDIVLLLLQDPRVDPSAQNGRPIILASRKGHLNVVKLLSRDPRVIPLNGLRTAVYSYKYEVVNFIIRNVSDDISDFFYVLRDIILDRKVKTELEGKCLQDIVQYLLEKGLDPSQQQNIVFINACQYGYTNIVGLLLKCSKVNVCDRNSIAFRTSCENGHFEIVKLLLEDGRINTSQNIDRTLSNALVNGYTKIVEMLLKKCKGIEASDYPWLLQSTNITLRIAKLILADSRVVITNRTLCHLLYNKKRSIVRLLLKDSRVGLNGVLEQLIDWHSEMHYDRDWFADLLNDGRAVCLPFQHFKLIQHLDPVIERKHKEHAVVQWVCDLLWMSDYGHDLCKYIKF